MWSKNQLAIAKTEWDDEMGTELLPTMRGATKLTSWWTRTRQYPAGWQPLYAEPTRVTHQAIRWADEYVYNLAKGGL